MAVVGVELTELWGRVVEHVSAGEPQHRAFLAMTKPLGLLQNEGGATSLLVAAPNAFAKDVLESRLRTVVNEVLTNELGEKAGVAKDQSGAVPANLLDQLRHRILPAMPQPWHAAFRKQYLKIGVSGGFALDQPHRINLAIGREPGAIGIGIGDGRRQPDAAATRR